MLGNLFLGGGFFRLGLLLDLFFGGISFRLGLLLGLGFFAKFLCLAFSTVLSSLEIYRDVHVFCGRSSWCGWCGFRDPLGYWRRSRWSFIFSRGGWRLWQLFLLLLSPFPDDLFPFFAVFLISVRGGVFGGFYVVLGGFGGICGFWRDIFRLPKPLCQVANMFAAPAAWSSTLYHHYHLTIFETKCIQDAMEVLPIQT